MALLIKSTTSNDEVEKNQDFSDSCNCEELCKSVIRSEEKIITTTTTIGTTTTIKTKDDDDYDDDSDDSDEKHVKKQSEETQESGEVEEEEEEEYVGVICARDRDLVERNFSSFCHMKCFNRCTRFEIRDDEGNDQILKYVIAHRES